MQDAVPARASTPWNKGRLIGQKRPLRLREVWAIRVRLQLAPRARNLALFNLALDSKLRGCDLTALRVEDVYQGSAVNSRAIVTQRKTNRPVQFELSEQTRESVSAWIQRATPSTGLPLPEPRKNHSPYFYSSIRENRAQVGAVYWLGGIGIRHAHHAKDEADTNLPKDQKSAHCTALSRAQQA